MKPSLHSLLISCLFQAIFLTFTARNNCVDATAAAFLSITRAQVHSSPLLNLSSSSPSLLSHRLVIETSCSISQLRGVSTGSRLFSENDNSSGVGFGQKEDKKPPKKVRPSDSSSTPMVPIETADTTKQVVLSIPASKVKTGALKFYLQIFIVGERNTPVKGSWTLNTNDKDGASASTLDVYYRDGTGMFSVIVSESSIVVERNGKRPSLEYLLQESVILHGLLDEVEAVAYGKDDEGKLIDKEKRLLLFDDDEDNNAINKAREKLPAKKAQ